MRKKWVGYITLLYVENKLMKPNPAVKKAVTNIDYIKGL